MWPIRTLAKTHSQQDPTFRGTLSYPRRTAAEALKQLPGLGFDPEVLPSPSTMADVLKRIVEFADHIGKPIQLLYYPPYHSKYNPVERCWGILEKQGNGTKRTDVDAMLRWAKSMTWKGVHPVVELSRKVYQKGMSLSKRPC